MKFSISYENCFGKLYETLIISSFLFLTDNSILSSLYFSTSAPSLMLGNKIKIYPKESKHSLVTDISKITRMVMMWNVK